MAGKMLGLVIAVVLAPAIPVAAAQGGGGLRQCFGDEITREETQMECVKVGNGEWEVIGEPGGGSGIFGTFLFFSILLSLVPAFIGTSLAKDAGVAGPVGFAIGLFASWIGVIGLYVVGQSQKRGTPVIQVGNQSPAPAAGGMGPAVGASSRPAAAEPSNAAERLRTLKDLLDQGLITQAEYDERRAATIESL